MTARTAALLLVGLAAIGYGQVCNDDTVSRVIYAEITTSSPIFQPEITLYGDAGVLSTRTRLTKNVARSSGGLYLRAPTDFQGPGGFSVKFSILSSVGATGVWELVVAPQEAQERRGGDLVVMLGAGRVAAALGGAEQCAVALAANVGDGGARAVWIDYVGFMGALEVRVGEKGMAGTRPAKATLRCALDVWGVLDIKKRHHVGIAARNGVGELAIADGIRVTDAYRPFDSNSCAVYARCKRKANSTLCVVPVEPGMCELQRCDDKYVWDVAGDLCCAFVEKASWVVNVSGFDSVGDRALCRRDRKTISFTADDRFCD